MGLLLSVLLGDQARQKDLITTYRTHCTDTIFSVSELKKLVDERPSQEAFLVFEVANLEETTLPDAGRIILDMNSLREKQFIALRASNSITIVWRRTDTLLPILVALHHNELPYESTSDRSVRILDISEEILSRVLETMKVTLTAGD